MLNIYIYIFFWTFPNFCFFCLIKEFLSHICTFPKFSLSFSLWSLLLPIPHSHVIVTFSLFLSVSDRIHIKNKNVLILLYYLLFAPFPNFHGYMEEESYEISPIFFNSQFLPSIKTKLPSTETTSSIIPPMSSNI